MDHNISSLNTGYNYISDVEVRLEASERCKLDSHSLKCIKNHNSSEKRKILRSLTAFLDETKRKTVDNIKILTPDETSINKKEVPCCEEFSKHKTNLLLIIEGLSIYNILMLMMIITWILICLLLIKRLIL